MPSLAEFLIFKQFFLDSGTGEANWLEGLHVAAKTLLQDFDGIAGIITYQLLFITDLTSPPPELEYSLINKIANFLNRINAFLYVVGPDIEPPFTIKSSQDVQTWMKNLVPNSENLLVLKKIISETKNSVVCDYKVGTNLFFSYRNWGGTQPWNVPLGIGTKVQIPSQTMKILNDIVQCKLVSSQGTIKPHVW